MKNILALIITLFFLFEGHSQMQGKVYVNSDKGDIVYFINDSLFIWITTCDKIEAGCFEMNIQGDFGIKNIRKVFDHFDFNNHLTDFGISAYMYTYDKNKILVDGDLEFYFEPKKKLNSKSGKYSFDYIGKYKKKNNLDSIAIKSNKVDTVRIYVKNSEKVIGDIQEYGKLNFYKKRGNKFYIDETKKTKKRVSEKFYEYIYDSENDRLYENYFIYFIKNIRIKEASRIGEFGDAGLVKLYNYDGSLKAMGVVYFLEKVGYWYYYAENGEIEKVEFHYNAKISPTGIKYNDILGTSPNYPVLKYSIPEGVEIIKIHYGG